MNNFYEDLSSIGMQQAILAEEVVLIGGNSGLDYLKGVDGKFFIPILMPEGDNKEIKTQSFNGVEQSNYLVLTIPPHLLLPFLNISLKASSSEDEEGGSSNTIVPTITIPSNGKLSIPAGTKFLIQFIDNDISSNKIMIVGIYKDKEE